MSLGLSHENLNKARVDSDKYVILQPAEEEFNILNNDGMTLKVVQDNVYDWAMNKIDSRRIVLEKKAEILHDYYGDRLIARDLFKDYLGQKRWTGGLANVLSLGLIGANMYSRVMKSSVFMGKVGTIGTILAIQAMGRYCSNNYLERRIEAPWKIHRNRMAQGLGPTNVISNHHREIENIPLKFLVRIS